METMTKILRAVERKASALAFLFVISLHPALSQEKQDPPVVIKAELPIYPLIAMSVGMEGVVTLKVTTDGTKVTSVVGIQGPAMLMKSAEKNIWTWNFLAHRPTTFITSFEYVITEPAQCYFTNPTATVHLPLSVRIVVTGLQTCDPSTTTSRPKH
jgi:hypothetical protein